MYNYIFWVIYRRNINRNKDKWLSKNNASGVVFFALFVHIILILTLIKWISGLKPDLSYFTNNRGVGILGVLLCISATYLYYSENRIAKIESKYINSDQEKKNNGLIVSIIIFIPLLIIIVLNWKG